MMMNLPCLRGSCPNFLRPIYHTLSASQAPKQDPCPMVNTDAGYSSCFFLFDCYWPAFIYYGTDLLSGRYTISGSCWSFADVVRSGLHHLRVSVPEPCPVSNSDYYSLDRVLEALTVLLFMLLLRLMQLLAVWCPLTFFADHSLFSA